MGTGQFNAGGNPAITLYPIQGGVEILLVASCYRNLDKLQPGGPHWFVYGLDLFICMKNNKNYVIIISIYDFNQELDQEN